MPQSTLLPLAVLYTDGSQRVEGATRFQKLVFLLQEQTNVPETYSYHADNFGPFSPQLHNDLRELTSEGVIEKNTVTNEVGNEKYVYSITPGGIRTVQRAVDRNDGLRRVFDAVQEIKREYNDQPLQHLLKYVYQKYPSYTTETELDLDRLFDPDVRSQFLDPDESPDEQFAGAPPGKWKELNSSAEDLFSV
jgi:uncharacterized protein YwgA